MFWAARFTPVLLAVDFMDFACQFGRVMAEMWEPEDVSKRKGMD